MGRTLLPFRMALDQEIHTWKAFRDSLSAPEQEIFDRLMFYARTHADAGSLAARALLSEVIFMGIAIEQQKEILRLNHEIISLSSILEKHTSKSTEDN